MYTLSGVVRTAYKQTTYTIRQEVAYKRLKTMGNNKTASCIRKPQVISGGGGGAHPLTPKRTRCFDSYVAIYSSNMSLNLLNLCPFYLEAFLI